MAYITLTIAADDPIGVPLNGRLELQPIGTRVSDPTLIGGGMRQYQISNGALPADARIVVGQKYQFTIYESGGLQPAIPPFNATATTGSTISVNALYRQSNGEPEEPLSPAYDAADLDYGDGATGDVWTRQSDGTMALQAPAEGEGSGAPSAHASTHATGGSDPVTPVSIGALPADHASVTNARAPLAHKASHATGGDDALTAGDIGAASAAALASEATARQTTDSTMLTMIASKANAEDLASEIAAREDEHATLLEMIEGIGTPTPASPLPYWASMRGPGSYSVWVGDSLGIGASVPIYTTDGWVPLVATGFQNAFSPGRHPTGRVPIFMSAPFLPDEVSHFPDVDVDAGIIAMGAYMTGPGTASLRTQTTGARYRRFNARFTTLGVEHVITDTRNYNKGGDTEVRVDGTLVGTLSGSIDPATGLASLRYAAIVTIVAEGLPDVEHTVELRHVSTAPNLFSRWFGLRCYDPLGVNVDSYSRHDARTEWYGNTLPAELITDPEYGGYGQPGRMISGLDLEHYKLDGTPWTFPGYSLIVYALGINNITAAGHTLAAMRLDVLRFLRGMYAPSSANRNASLIMILPGQDETYPGAGVPRADAVALYREVVEQVVPPHCGAVFIDMQPRPVGYDWPAHFDAELHAAASSPHLLDATLYANRVLEVATA